MKKPAKFCVMCGPEQRPLDAAGQGKCGVCGHSRYLFKLRDPKPRQAAIRADKKGAK